MLHPNTDVWLDPGYRRQDMIQDLLGRHAERPAPRGDLHPAAFVKVIAFREVLGAEQDEVAVIGEAHINLSRVLVLRVLNA